MVEAWLTAVEAGALSSGLRKSLWVYPIVNTLHLIGIALLLGSILVFDARLAGFWSRQPLAPLATVLLPAARAGFVIAILTGALLFVSRPLDYAFDRMFQAKLALIVVALANVVLIHASAAWRRAMRGEPAGARLRFGAAVSALLWVAVVFAGRFLGYR